MKRSPLTVALLLCVLCTGALAQRSGPSGVAPVARDRLESAFDAARPTFRQFTDKDGLPQNSTQALLVDRRGYLWAATQDGAASYNGRAWTVVNMPHRSVSNYINALLETADGSMWFGTDRGGIARLAGDQWTVYGEAEGLPSAHIRCLAEGVGPGGTTTVWVGTAKGLARLEGDRFAFVDTGFEHAREYVMGLHASRAEDGAPVLWVGTFKDGLLRYDGARWEQVGREAGVPTKVLSVFEAAGPGGGNALWAATDAGAMYLEAGRWGVLTAEDGLPSSLTRGFAEAIAPDGTRTLWIASYGGVASVERGRVRAFSPATGYPFDAATSVLASSPPGGTPIVWIGLNGPGLVRMRGGGWRAHSTKSGLPYDNILSFTESGAPGGARHAWVGTGRGIARWDGESWTIFDRRGGLKADGAKALAATKEADGSTTVWAGTGAGLMRYQGGSWTVFDAESGVLPDNEVLVIRETDGGALLLGLGGSGLLRFEDGRATVVADTSSGLPDNRVQSLLETRAAGGARVLWVGTNNGLARRDGDRWRVYDTSSGMPNNVILSLHEMRAPDGRRWLWAGTYGGAARLALDDPDASWERFTDTTTPALPNNTVYQVVSDRAGRVYLTTNRGVARLAPRTPTPEDPSTLSLYTFTTEDGLPANECNVGAAYADADGRLWVGTVAGVGVYDPGAETPDLDQKQLYIERSLLGGVPHRFGPNEELEHDQNNIVFEFSLLSYFRESDTRYRTQLVGLEQEPSSWTSIPQREYPSLPAGSYTFKVWAKDYAGNVSGPVAVTFLVKPAPWLTWWAFAAYAVALAGLGWLVLRLRLEALRRSNRLLEAKVVERTLELRQSERRAREASLAKSVFLANMSHELRTPLNAILGFIQLMERDATLTAEQRENLSVIERSGEHLLGLINDVLSLSKIEAGQVELRDDPFDLHRMLDGVAEMFQTRARAKHLVFSVERSEGLPRYVRGDEGKLRQVLINLVGNALKFTDAGAVTVRVGFDDGLFRFEVEDTGHGIAEAEIGKLFSAFSQTESGRKASEGTGLGLVISRSFVRAMGGDMRVESQKGKGSTFGFEVPLSAADAAEIAGDRPRVLAIAPGQPEYRVLVVDDRLENRLLLAKLLSKAGFAVREAANGREAVETWEAWRPHLIWMDIRMPVLDGYGATREIRRLEAEEGAPDAVRKGAEDVGPGAGQSPWPEHSEASNITSTGGPTSPQPPGPSPLPAGPSSPGRTWIIALTASALEDDRAAVYEAGCDGFVPKPYRHDVIFEKLAETLGVRYLYDETIPVQRVDAADLPIDRARLASVPAEVRSKLARALVHGDLSACLALIAEIGSLDEALAGALQARASGYEFDEMLEALEAVEAGDSGLTRGAADV